MSSDAYPGKLVTVGVNDLIYGDWPRNVHNGGYTVKWTQRKNYDKNNTYISIFGPNQQEQFDVFKKDPYYKIIYEAPKAVNRREGHGFSPRNTLVVWEVADNEQSSSN